MKRTTAGLQAWLSVIPSAAGPSRQRGAAVCRLTLPGPGRILDTISLLDRSFCQLNPGRASGRSNYDPRRQAA